MNEAGLIVFGLSALLLLGGSLLWVLSPLWRGAPPLDPPDPRVLALLAQRESTLASMRDLEADHRDGRLGDEVYAKLRQDLVELGASLLSALDRLSEEQAGQMARMSAALEAEIAAAGGGSAVLPELPASDDAATATAPGSSGPRCAGCDRALAADARFCDHCGRPVEADAPASGAGGAA